tara:strand:+ start:1011 stop:1172 length:162 start_codon:yes stop_codon:yes gene_type:complete
MNADRIIGLEQYEEDKTFSDEEMDCFKKFVKDCGFDGFFAINGVQNDEDKKSS